MCSASAGLTPDELAVVNLRDHLIESADEADEQSKASDQTVVARQQQLAAAAQAPVLTSAAMMVLRDSDYDRAQESDQQGNQDEHERRNLHPDDDDEDDEDEQYQDDLDRRPDEHDIRQLAAATSQRACQDSLVSRMRDIIEGPGEQKREPLEKATESVTAGGPSAANADAIAAQGEMVPMQPSTSQQPKRARHPARPHCMRHHHLHHQSSQQGAALSAGTGAHLHHLHHHHHHHHQRPNTTSQTARQQQDFCPRPRVTSSNDQRPVTGDHRIGAPLEVQANASDNSTSARPQVDDNIALNDQSKTPSSSSDSSRKVLAIEAECGGGSSSSRIIEKQDPTSMKGCQDKENQSSRVHHHGRRHSHAHHHHHHHHRTNHKRRFVMERAASGEADSTRTDRTMLASFGAGLDTAKSQQDATHLKSQPLQDSSNIGHCPHHHHICAGHSGSSACKRHSHHHHHHHHSHHHHSPLGAEQESSSSKGAAEADKTHSHHGHHHHHHHHHHSHHHHHGHHARHRHRLKHRSSNDGLADGELVKVKLMAGQEMQIQQPIGELTGGLGGVKIDAAKQGVTNENITIVPSADDIDIRMHLDEEEQQEQNKLGLGKQPIEPGFKQNQNLRELVDDDDDDNDGEVRMELSPNGSPESRLAAHQASSSGINSQVCEMASSEENTPTEKVELAANNQQAASGSSQPHQGNGLSRSQPNGSESLPERRSNESHQTDKQQILRQISSSINASRKSSQQRDATSGARQDREVVEQSSASAQCSQDAATICQRANQPRQVIESSVEPNDRRCRMCWCCCCPCSG